jgi:protocatechuate 3,4-dioxygenase beta subunit
MSEAIRLGRRVFLRGTGAMIFAPAVLPLVGCGSRDGSPPPEAPRPGPGPSPGVTGPTPECAETEDNIEGPYYRPGAPMRADLTDPGMSGTRLTIHGRVLGPDCTTPLAGALLDVWQANADGHYDNDGSMRLTADRYLLRGKLTTDASGAFSIQTIVPGRYLNGPQYRPAHVHVKLSAPGHRALTTQLYFPDDPYNDVDPFIHRSLIMNVTPTPQGARDAHFDFVLA